MGVKVVTTGNNNKTYISDSTKQDESVERLLLVIAQLKEEIVWYDAQIRTKDSLLRAQIRRYERKGKKKI